jgi:hypothetical protein
LEQASQPKIAYHEVSLPIIQLLVPLREASFSLAPDV